MSYPGNPSLEPEIQQRVLDTFRQSVALAEGGDPAQAELGCDFILRLDPTFEPARILKTRLERGGDRALELDDMRRSLPEIFAETPGEEPQPEDLAPTDREELDDTDEPAAEGARELLLQAFEEREFGRVLQLVELHRSELTGDAEVRRLVGEARSRLEAEPYVRDFLAKARDAAREGHDARAEELIQKARSLDESHPGIEELESARAVYRDSEGRIGHRRDFDSADEATSAPNGPESAPQPPRDESDAAPESAAEADSESAQRIAELLAEGQASFEDQDFQSAIDSWSRIFLIDIDHAEATSRIEEARRQKAETEREVEEIYHDAVQKLNEGERDAARDGFQRVLQRVPDHLSAQEQLSRLDREPTTEAPPRVGAAPPQPEAEAAAEVAPEDLYPEELADLPTPKKPDASEPARAAPPKLSRLNRFLGISALVLVVALAGAWWLFSQREEVFPNAGSAAPSTAGAEAPDPITHAEELHAAGQIPQAIEVLRGIPREDDQYAAAQALIAQWQTSPAAPDGPSDEDLARREELLVQARSAYSAGDYLAAAERLRTASEIAPVAGATATLQAQVQERLAPVAEQLELFRTGDWDFALPDLWRMHEAEPGNRIVTRMLVTGYYNLAVRDLQRSDPRGAAEKLQEAARLSPGDRSVQRLLAFAESYSGAPQDLQYRLFVKYVPFR